MVPIIHLLDNALRQIVKEEMPKRKKVYTLIATTALFLIACAIGMFLLYFSFYALPYVMQLVDSIR